MSDDLDVLSRKLGQLLVNNSFKIAVAESCTGGWLAKCITDIEGSSAWFERGFVTYTNEAKQEMLGVSNLTLVNNGAVSEAVVMEMAAGAMHHSHAQVAVAISGVAGPSGGTPDKPVGTVWIACTCAAGSTHTLECHFDGDREAVRRASVTTAMEAVCQVLGECDINN